MFLKFQIRIVPCELEDWINGCFVKTYTLHKLCIPSYFCFRFCQYINIVHFNAYANRQNCFIVLTATGVVALKDLPCVLFFALFFEF